MSRDPESGESHFQMAKFCLKKCIGSSDCEPPGVEKEQPLCHQILSVLSSMNPFFPKCGVHREDATGIVNFLPVFRPWSSLFESGRL
jgi:hypothetical protein